MGAWLGSWMGFDGSAVDHYSRAGNDEIDIQTVGMELAHAITPDGQGVERLELGHAAEITVRTDSLVVLVYVLSKEYFVACAVAFLRELRQGALRECAWRAPQIRAEL